MSKIGIVILIYNEWNISIDCIKSIRKNNIYYHIYIVDNCSTISPTKKFMDFINCSEDITFIRNKVNKGYSAGNNIGIKKAISEKCEYILVCNNDVFFEEHAIEYLLTFLKYNKEYGIVGPEVHLLDGSLQEINMCTKTTLLCKYLFFLRKTPLKKLVNNYVNEYQGKNKNLKYPFDVFAVSGCCFLMSPQAVKVIYPLDEGTFLYEEENIIGIVMEKAELKTAYVPQSKIVHVGGVSTSSIGKFAFQCISESEVYYFRKYMKSLILQLIPLITLRCIQYVHMFGIKDVHILLKKIIVKLREKEKEN